MKTTDYVIAFVISGAFRFQLQRYHLTGGDHILASQSSETVCHRIIHTVHCVCRSFFLLLSYSLIHINYIGVVNAIKHTRAIDRGVTATTTTYRISTKSNVHHKHLTLPTMGIFKKKSRFFPKCRHLIRRKAMQLHGMKWF